MSDPYRPEAHAAALADWTGLITHLARDVASLRGDVARLLQLYEAQAKEPPPHEALDDLIDAAYQAMAGITWSTGELIGRSLHPDAAGLNLRQAIQLTGKTTPKALGRYLSHHVPSAGHTTHTPLELRCVGRSDNVLCWVISGVSGV